MQMPKNIAFENNAYFIIDLVLFFVAFIDGTSELRINSLGTESPSLCLCHISIIYWEPVENNIMH